MTNEERQLMLGTHKDVLNLFQDRNDLLVGITAALLDLYRTLIFAGSDSKDAALLRLRAQRTQIIGAIPNGVGSISLQWLIDSLETGKLDAAKLIREPSAGTA